MTQIIPAEQIALYQLEEKFALQQVESEDFFPEWQGVLPELTEVEKEQLERVKANFLYLSTRSLLEEMVKMVVVSPLLDLAGFYQPPFYPIPEKSVQISARDESSIVKGKIDVLVIKEQFWVLVIESKRAEFSLKVGIPQALSYMLANPHPNQPLYGLVTNGSNFVFLKLVQGEKPYYARSEEFVLDNPHELERVLQILKQLAQVMRGENTTISYQAENC